MATCGRWIQRFAMIGLVIHSSFDGPPWGVLGDSVTVQDATLLATQLPSGNEKFGRRKGSYDVNSEPPGSNNHDTPDDGTSNTDENSKSNGGSKNSPTLFRSSFSLQITGGKKLSIPKFVSRASYTPPRIRFSTGKGSGGNGGGSDTDEEQGNNSGGRKTSLSLGTFFGGSSKSGDYDVNSGTTGPEGSGGANGGGSDTDEAQENNGGGKKKTGLSLGTFFGGSSKSGDYNVNPGTNDREGSSGANGGGSDTDEEQGNKGRGKKSRFKLPKMKFFRKSSNGGHNTQNGDRASGRDGSESDEGSTSATNASGKKRKGRLSLGSLFRERSSKDLRGADSTSQDGESEGEGGGEKKKKGLLSRLRSGKGFKTAPRKGLLSLLRRTSSKNNSARRGKGTEESTSNSLSRGPKLLEGTSQSPSDGFPVIQPLATDKNKMEDIMAGCMPLQMTEGFSAFNGRFFSEGVGCQLRRENEQQAGTETPPGTLE